MEGSDVEHQRRTGWWLGVIDNLTESLDQQQGQRHVELSLYAWDVQVVSTALVRLSLDLRNEKHSADTVAVLTRNLHRDHGRDVSVANLSGLDSDD